MFPNAKAEVDIYATRPPVGRVSGNEVHIVGYGEADFYIRPNGVRTDLFSINMVTYYTATLVQE